MKINNKLSVFLPLLAVVLVGCSSNINTYQEPEGQNVSTIKIGNRNFVGAVLSSAVMIPNNEIFLDSIDDKPIGFGFSNEVTKITPGRHKLIFACTINGATVSKASIIINAAPGRTYFVSYPDNMKSYNFDTEICKKLIIR